MCRSEACPVTWPENENSPRLPDGRSQKTPPAGTTAPRAPGACGDERVPREERVGPCLSLRSFFTHLLSFVLLFSSTFTR